MFPSLVAQTEGIRKKSSVSVDYCTLLFPSTFLSVLFFLSFIFYFSSSFIFGARGSALRCCTMIPAGKWRVRFPMRTLDFSIDLILPGPEVDSPSNRNEYQESSWGKGRRQRKANNLTTICEPFI
jgi:hypothetical protein